MKPMFNTQQRQFIIDGKTTEGQILNLNLHWLKLEREIIKKIQKSETPELIVFFTIVILVLNIANYFSS